MVKWHKSCPLGTTCSGKSEHATTSHKQHVQKQLKKNRCRLTGFFKGYMGSGGGGWGGVMVFEAGSKAKQCLPLKPGVSLPRTTLLAPCFFQSKTKAFLSTRGTLGVTGHLMV